MEPETQKSSAKIVSDDHRLRLAALPRSEEVRFWRDSRALLEPKLSAQQLALEFMKRFNDDKVIDGVFAETNGGGSDPTDPWVAGIFAAVRPATRTLIDGSIFTLARKELAQPELPSQVREELAHFVPEPERRGLVKHFAAVQALRKLVEEVLPPADREWGVQSFESDHPGLGNRSVRVSHETGLRLWISESSFSGTSVHAITAFGIVSLWRGTLDEQGRKALSEQLNLSQVPHDLNIPMWEDHCDAMFNIGNVGVLRGAQGSPAGKSRLELDPARGATWDLLTDAGGDGTSLLERPGQYVLERTEPSEAVMPKVDFSATRTLMSTSRETCEIARQLHTNRLIREWPEQFVARLAEYVQASDNLNNVLIAITQIDRSKLLQTMIAVVGAVSVVKQYTEVTTALIRELGSAVKSGPFLDSVDLDSTLAPLVCQFSSSLSKSIDAISPTMDELAKL